MCGIAGFVDERWIAKPDALRAHGSAMSAAIQHRGPDGDGLYIEPEAGLALAHRRLAIVDITPAGAQPMVSASGRFVICYNGEVYNAEDMRRDQALAKLAWRGHSDTEVILEFAEAHGIARMLQEANGMFALALWDRQERLLHLARDRMGIKPLFIAHLPTGIAFASEIKALLALDGFHPRMDPASVATFLQLAYIPAPQSIYSNVRKLLPGTYETIDLSTGWAGAAPKSRVYWSLRDAATAGQRSQLRLTDTEATEQLADLLRDAVTRQMTSDVPFGALLSGGIDSSLVTAMMVGSGAQVRTFSIGFETTSFDESHHAESIAQHLGTIHTPLRVTSRDALDVIPLLPTIYDEPFADSSQIPTYLVSKLTRQHVTVALSGDGGDELFAGYNRHRFAAGLGQSLPLIPQSLRKLAAVALSALPPSSVEWAARRAPARFEMAQAAEKLRKLARVLPLDGPDMYRSLIRQIDNIEMIAPALARYTSQVHLDVPTFPNLVEEMQYRDMLAYLPDDILQKVDRASMAVALEVRPPLLDHRIVEFAWRLPPHLKIRRGETKWLLRRVLERRVPASLFERPKMGFAVPLDDWLRGPLSEWANDLLASSSSWSDFLDPALVANVWRRHVTGRENLAAELWPILMFGAWSQARPCTH